jgi:hypothetical protein
MKIYRCGWCGVPTNSKGEPLILDYDKYLEIHKDCETEKVNGTCCQHENEQQQMQVTREMATDAGEPDMEGAWINWG